MARATRPGFFGPLNVELVSETPRRWRLTGALLYRSQVYKLDNNGPATAARELARGVLVVPAGFVTDFASVPRVPVAFLVAGDIAIAPAALHDWLYTVQVCERALADAVFLEAMESAKVNWLKRKLMYRAVRWFGRARWAAVTPRDKLKAVDLLRAWSDDVRAGPQGCA